ncbi:ATP-binding protein [Ideonella azotifigens]|nr:winged helix-turn-helix domain-containing protein [Ideonella azotifigens]
MEKIMKPEPREATPSSYEFGKFLLVPERQALLESGTQVRIGGRAFEMLTVLVTCAGEVVSKRELLERVWPDTVVEESNLKVHMAALRRVLGDDPSAARYVATVTGRGYRFIAEVTAHTSPAGRASSSTSTPRRSNLPAGRASVLGRDDVIDMSWDELTQCRLISIVGAGGVGKTTVALAVAERALGAFKDGVWLIDLASLTEPHEMPGAIASAMGLALHGPGEWAALCEHLRELALLLVLDNCEHLIDGAARYAAQILATAANVKILATSRAPLQMAGERVRRLAGLCAPPRSERLNATQALRFPAIQLFVERATSSFERFEFHDADAAAISEICRRLDGLALAIELAAACIPAFGVGGLLGQLDNRLHLLMGRRAGPERHRSLAASFDWSHALLSEAEATVLRAVSVFDGEFDCPAAAAVTDLSLEQTTEALGTLAEKSLVTANFGGPTVSYFLPETTRHCCLERLALSGQEHLVRFRLAHHRRGALDQQGAALSPRDTGQQPPNSPCSHCGTKRGAACEAPPITPSKGHHDQSKKLPEHLSRCSGCHARVHAGPCRTAATIA